MFTSLCQFDWTGKTVNFRVRLIVFGLLSLPFAAISVDMGWAIHMLVVVKGSQEVPGPIHWWRIGKPLGCIHQDQILKVLQLRSAPARDIKQKMSGYKFMSNEPQTTRS